MDALQASAPLWVCFSRRDLDNPVYIRVVRLLAKIPTMVAAFQLMRNGNDPVRPRDDLITPPTFCMLNEREPDPLAANIFDVLNTAC